MQDTTIHIRPFVRFKLNAILPVLFFAVQSVAQTGDTLKLDEVAVTPRLKDFSVTQNIISADTFLKQVNGVNNLGQLLQSQNFIFVKSYGPSSVGTSSIRGGSAGHTAVTWNGINIRNAMLGENDLSMLSVCMNDDVKVQYGGSTAMWGSGSVAGSIHLGNEPKFNNGFFMSTTFSNGSFGNNAVAVKADYSRKKYFTTTRVLAKSAQNNFWYYDENRIKKRTEHADLRMIGLLHEEHFRISRSQSFSLRFWTQSADREIPPLLTQAKSTAAQNDNFHRAMGEWQFKKENWKLLLKNGVFYEKLNYTDSLSDIISNAASFTNSSEAELLISSRKQNKFQFGLNNTFCSAESDGYAKAARQNYASLFAGYLWSGKNEKHFVSLNLRQEMTKRKFVPFTASAAFSSALFSWMELKGSISKLYRLPSFNSLYWTPGGNPELLPEQGFSGDLSLILKRTKTLRSGRIDFRILGTVFSRLMNNWIIWLPGSNGIWSPQNLLRVWSRGAESNSSVTFIGKKITARLFVLSNYILSSNQQSKSGHDESVGRQLIYTPMYSGSAGIQVKYKRFYFSFIHNYTGYRYITADNYNYLLPYDLADLSSGYSFTVKKVFFDLNFSVNNLVNKSYQIIAQRPMPMMNYLVNLKISYHKNTQK